MCEFLVLQQKLCKKKKWQEKWGVEHLFLTILEVTK
jgi:hypothetical protein